MRRKTGLPVWLVASATGGVAVLTFFGILALESGSRGGDQRGIVERVIDRVAVQAVDRELRARGVPADQRQAATDAAREAITDQGGGDEAALRSKAEALLKDSPELRAKAETTLQDR